MIAHVHPDDFAEFVDLEDNFIDLFDDHGLVLRHRFRDTAGSTEVQVIESLASDSLDTYFADPRRVALRDRFAALRLDQRVHVVEDAAENDSSCC